MSTTSRSSAAPVERASQASFAKPRTLALVAISGVIVYLLYLLFAPFSPALTWATALAVSAYPLHSWLQRRVTQKNAAAGLAVFLVAVVVVLPAVFVTHRLIIEANQFRHRVQEEIASGRLREAIEQQPQLAAWMPWIESQFQKSNEAAEASEQQDASAPEEKTSQSSSVLQQQAPSMQQAAGMLTSGVGTVLSSLLWLLGQLFITFLALFFFFRDRERFLPFFRKLIPLSDTETKHLFRRIDDVIHATVYGSLTVAAVQGTMGGLMFWWLDLPSPLLWGSVMGLLAVVPVLGTFVIWGPTAIFLAMQGNWVGALTLAGWGGIAIALVDNFLYPYLVGTRMRYHTLPVFLAVVGGLALFGASGVILGPVLLAVADALIEAWRKPTRKQLAT